VKNKTKPDEGKTLCLDSITAVLDSYRDLKVETIFVIRGDRPREKDFIPHPNSFAYASDLIAFIKERYDFTLGCAGYPEGHIEAQTFEKDIEFLKLKVDNGAQYVVAQYFYDNDYFFRYVEKCRTAGIEVPIILGFMPVYTLKMKQALSKICGTKNPKILQQKLDEVDIENKTALLNLGINFAVEQCRGLLKKGVPSLHFYTMNRSKSTLEIINQLRRENLL